MIISTVEWELRQLDPGTEVLIVDENNRPVARGVLRPDRRSLIGPNGEFISLKKCQPGWQLAMARRK